MEIEKMTMEMVEARSLEIKNLLEQEGADVEALSAEVDELEKRKAAIMAEVEERNALAKDIENETAEVEVRDEIIEEEIRMEFTRESREYRNAWLNKIRGVELSEVEERAFAQAGSAIAVETANDIMTHIRKNAPILEKMTVVYSAANVNYYVENTINDASSHTENAAITAAADTLTKISLVPAEIVKMIQVSEAAKQMSVDAFEAWIAKMVGECIAAKINALTTAVITAGATSAGTAVSAATVQALLGGAKGDCSVICSRKMLYTGLLPLQDNGKNALVRFEGAEATIYGCPVLVDDSMDDKTVLCGPLNKVVAAMAEEPTIRSAYDIDHNAYKYLGVCLFDVKMGDASAFTKIVVAG